VNHNATPTDLKSLVSMLEDDDISLGDYCDAVYESGGGLYAAYVINHHTVVYYDYRHGFYRAETFDDISDAYESAEEYAG
jgi:hypothetical protein